MRSTVIIVLHHHELFKQIKPPRHTTLNIRLNNIKQYRCTRTKGQIPPAPIHGASSETCSLMAIVKQRVRKAKPKHTYFFERAQDQNIAIEIQASRAWGTRRARKLRKVFWHLSVLARRSTISSWENKRRYPGADTKPPIDRRRLCTAHNEIRPRLIPSSQKLQTRQASANDSLTNAHLNTFAKESERSIAAPGANICSSEPAVARQPATIIPAPLRCA